MSLSLASRPPSPIVSPVAGPQGDGKRSHPLQPLKEFLQGATAPHMILGMAVGSSVFQGVKYLGLARWFATAQPGALAQWTARGASVTTALAAEVPAFLGTEAAFRYVFHGAELPEGPAWVDQGIGLGLQLTLLRGFRAGATGIFYRAQGISPVLGPGRPLPGWRGTTQKFLPGVSSVGALWLGQYAEAYRQGAPTPTANQAGAAALIFALQFSIAGRLSHFLQGAGLRRGLAELNLRSIQLETSSNGKGFNDSPWAYAVAGKETARISPYLPRPVAKDPRYLHAFSEGSGSENPWISSKKLPRLLANVFSRKIQRPPNDPQLEKIIENVLQTNIEDIEGYPKLLSQTKVTQLEWKTPLGTVETLSRGDVMEIATGHFRRVMDLNPFYKVYGTFYDYLTQVALEDVVARRDAKALTELIHLAAGDPTLKKMRVFFKDHGLAQDYQMGWEGVQLRLAPDHLWTRVLNKFILGPSPKPQIKMLQEYFGFRIAKGSMPPRLQAYRNWIQLATGERISMAPERAFRSLRYFHDHVKQNKDLRTATYLGWALKRADQSPFPLLVMDRLIKVLATADPQNPTEFQPRFFELCFGDEFRWSRIQNGLKLFSQGRGPEEALKETVRQWEDHVFSGYLSNPKLTERLVQIYREVPKLLEPEGARGRREKFAEHVEKVLEFNGGKLGRNAILELLTFNATTASLLAATAVYEHKIDLRVVSPSEFARYYPGMNKKPEAAFVPPEHRLPGEPDRPLILVQELEGRPGDPSHLLGQAIRLPQRVVHEFSHFRADYRPGKKGPFFSNRRDQLSGEFMALLEDHYYLLNQGFRQSWLAMEHHPFGPPGYLRSQVEANYFGEMERVFPD